MTETGGRAPAWRLVTGAAPSLVFGLFIYYYGFVAILNSGLGMYPGGVFTVGVAAHAPLTIGQVNQALQATFLLMGWYLGFPPGLGTLVDLTLSGILIDLFIGRGLVPVPELEETNTEGDSHRSFRNIHLRLLNLVGHNPCWGARAAQQAFFGTFNPALDEGEGCIRSPSS